MWMRLRVWWYLLTKAGNIPMEVRIYIIRKNMKAAIESQTTPEQKRKFAAELLAGALDTENEPLPLEVTNELIATSFKMLEGMPTAGCCLCSAIVYLDEAIK